jgi:hypothetical protein
MLDVTIVVVSALVGAVVSYVLAVIQHLLDVRTKMDENLRQDRLTVYKVLWERTGLLPQWPRSTTVTYEKLLNLSTGMRDWYFTQGGIYLSEKTRRVYGNTQEAIQVVLRKAQNMEETLPEEQYGAIREKLSRLRTQMTRDLLSRRAAPWLP